MSTSEQPERSQTNDLVNRPNEVFTRHTPPTAVWINEPRHRPETEPRKHNS